MSIKKDLKTIREIVMAELKLLRKGETTNQRAREISRLGNTIISAVRTSTKRTDECN